jgi:CubicO group peptidase (beta-lactamase class C family)
MKDTGVHTRGAHLANEAKGYALAGGRIRRVADWDMSWVGAAGALYSTVGDLERWNEAVFGGKVLSAASARAAFTPVRLNGSQAPAEGGYGYGWYVGKLRGASEIQHGGGLEGFEAQLTRFPEQKLTVVALTNASPPAPGLAPSSLVRDIAQIFLGDALAPRPVGRAIELPEEALQDFVGRYDYGRLIMTVSREGRHLFAQLTGQRRLEIFPRSESEFFWKAVEAQVTFVRDGSGRVVKAVHHQGGRTIEAPRLPAP